MWILILISFLVVLVAIILFYELYWLNQPQIFLVYQPKGKFTTFDKDMIKSVETVTGAKIATKKEMEAEIKEGLNVCANGMLVDDNGSYILGWPTYVDKDFNGSSDGKDTCAPVCDKKAGCISGCGCNKMFNVGSWGTTVKGVWLYGTKPTKLPSSWSSKGWKIAKFSSERQGLGKNIVNKYEIFGIPKFF